MTPEEKTILLGALFHDIGKFEQCCSKSNPGCHTEAGTELLKSLKEEILPLLDDSELHFKDLCDLVERHHEPGSVLSFADKISAGKETEKETATEKSLMPDLIFLSSVFSSVRLSSVKNVNDRFYNQVALGTNNHKLISTLGNHPDTPVSYTKNDFDSFKSDLKVILSSFNKINDFSSVFSLILNLLEDRLWCVPDYTDGSIRDISLFNHLKDTAGFAHAIHKTIAAKPENRYLVLIVGDLPGIQKYIFNVLNKKPAKILRGRSVFVQVITRVFAGIFLKNFGLTEASMIMNAGGKFYIVAPGSDDFEKLYKMTNKEINDILSANFFYELNFASGFTKFDYQKLANGEFGFGSLIDDASYHLLNGRNRPFESDFFSDFRESKFVLEADYVSSIENDNGTDSIKCAVTDKPVRKGRQRSIKDEDDSYHVDLQVENEFNIGDIVPKKPVVCSIRKNGLSFTLERAVPLNEFKSTGSAFKVIINPSISEIITKLKNDDSGELTNLFKDTSYIGVANYASRTEKSGSFNSIMSFEEMAENCRGAQLLTLIKGDVDNLGLIMSVGLDQANPVSRTTTMSNHLRYFFSSNLNDLLDQNCGSDDKRAYTVYAGGDDLLLVTTQSYSLELLRQINDKFNQFVCHNPEIHISYSMTNFKHSTPIMLVAGFAEESQNEIKKFFKNPRLSKAIDENSFLKSNDKAGVMIFDTPVKSDLLDEFISWSNRLKKWTELSPSTPISKGAIRHIFEISKIMNDYYDNKKPGSLIWHPFLTYYIKRNIKVNFEFNNAAEQDYFRKFLSQILKIEKEDGFDIKSILHPLMNSVILKTRN